MNVLTGLIEASWREYPAAIVMMLGLVQLWRGLHGGRNGEGGMLRRHAGAVGRIEGWRRAILGLSVVGLGAAWMWQSPLLLFLAIGIGFCEGQESSKVLAAMRWDGDHGRRRVGHSP